MAVERSVRPYTSVRFFLALIACVLFALTAFGVHFGPAHLGWLGLAFLAGSFLA